MQVLLPIGDFSRMTHLSVKALRHYHEIGLLEPADVDSSTGYRFYEPGQVATAQVIRRFRDLGMPLEQVKEVIEAPDVASRNRAIVGHLERMERQLANTQSTVASLRALLEEPMTPASVEYRSVGSALTLAISESVGVAEVEEWWVGAFDELYRVIGGSGSRPVGPGGALYHKEIFELERGVVVAFVPVGSEVAARGRTEIFEVPAAELAVMLHEGPFADLDQTYGALGTHVAERAIGVEGPIREYYLVTPADTDDESKHRTEVCWPIFQTRTVGELGGQP